MWFFCVFSQKTAILSQKLLIFVTYYFYYTPLTTNYYEIPKTSYSKTFACCNGDRPIFAGF